MVFVWMFVWMFLWMHLLTVLCKDRVPDPADRLLTGRELIGGVISVFLRQRKMMQRRTQRQVSIGQLPELCLRQQSAVASGLQYTNVVRIS